MARVWVGMLGASSVVARAARYRSCSVSISLRVMEIITPRGHAPMRAALHVTFPRLPTRLLRHHLRRHRRREGRPVVLLGEVLGETCMVGMRSAVGYAPTRRRWRRCSRLVSRMTYRPLEAWLLVRQLTILLLLVYLRPTSNEFFELHIFLPPRVWLKIILSHLAASRVII